MFLILEDPRAKVQGSRDPLGVQPIWARFGRDVVTNLTTVSRMVRGFTVVLLGRYFGERLLEEGQVEEDEIVPVFLRFEQIAAYARYLRNPEDSYDIVLGITRVTRLLDEYNGIVPIQDDPTGWILSDQKIYGLWGLYSVPARVSGLLADGPVGLTPWARAFVEQNYLPSLGHVYDKLLDLVRDGGQLNTRQGQQLFEWVARLLTSEFSQAERTFYGEALRDAQQVTRTEAAERQRQLADLMRRTCQPDSAMGREALDKLARAAEFAGYTALANRLHRILRLEATLAPAGALFNLMLARNGQPPTAIATQLRDCWGREVPHLSGSIEPLLPEMHHAASKAQVQHMQHCDQAMAHGVYEEAIRALIAWNGQ